MSTKNWSFHHFRMQKVALHAVPEHRPSETPSQKYHVRRKSAKCTANGYGESAALLAAAERELHVEDVWVENVCRNLCIAIFAWETTLAHCTAHGSMQRYLRYWRENLGKKLSARTVLRFEKRLNSAKALPVRILKRKGVLYIFRLDAYLKTFSVKRMMF